MSNQQLRFALVLPSLVLALSLVILKSPESVLSAVSGSLVTQANHVVISEVMVGVPGEADNEFVELYNPTASAIDLSGWRLSRKTSESTTAANLVASMSGTIASKSYFLVSPSDFVATHSADLPYSTGNNLTANNTILLFSDAGQTLVDKVGMGTANDFESSPAANPAPGTSIERKANSMASIASMIIGGIHEFMGNAEDTNNNLNDFIVREIPQPQNSQSSIEPELSTPTPSASESATPSAIPTPTTEPTPTPTVEPSPTPSPTEEPTPTPSPTESPTPSPSPTVEPTPTPTATPTAEPTATPSATPSPTPSATPTPLPVPSPSVIAAFPFFNGQAQVCTLSYIPMQFGFFNFYMPKISCAIVTL